MMPPVRVADFHADQQGRWKYYRRDSDDMYIEAKPPVGYGPFWLPDDQRVQSIMSPLKSGQCPTNEIILRLRIIDPVQPPKDAK